MNFSVWLPLLARRDLALGPDGFGLLMAALGIGSFSGALLLAFAGRRPSRRLMLTTAAGFGALEGGVALAAVLSLPLSVIVGLIAGVGGLMSITMALANTSVQTVVPDALRGRVMSIYMTVFAGTAPLGATLAGLVATAAGTPVAIAAGGGVVLATAITLAIGGRLSVTSRRPMAPSTGAPAQATGGRAIGLAGLDLPSRQRGDT
jgi:MFS family permease